MRSHALSVSLQIMVALRFYATGSFQQVNADVHRISRASVSYIIRAVTNCIKGISHQYIKMPIDQGELRNIMQGFHDIANFPNVVGAIDGTHVRIKSPSVDEHLYVNRKNYHSINVQGVCDFNWKFLNVVARWPGGTHDAFIWANSNLSDMFEDEGHFQWMALRRQWVSFASMAPYSSDQPNICKTTASQQCTYENEKCCRKEFWCAEIPIQVH